MNTVQKFEARQLEKISAGKEIPAFSVGDTVKVNLKIREGDRERVQAYEGVCIARSGSDINASFTVRKISYGEGVERVFPLWSPRIEGIELVRRGSVRRAKLYYLRDLRGKSARISERTTGHGIDTVDPAEVSAETKTEARKVKKEAKNKARAEARKELEAKAETKKKAKEAEAAAAQEAAATEANG